MSGGNITTVVDNSSVGVWCAANGAVTIAVT